MIWRGFGECKIRDEKGFPIDVLRPNRCGGLSDIIALATTPTISNRVMLGLTLVESRLVGFVPGVAIGVIRAVQRSRKRRLSFRTTYPKLAEQENTKHKLNETTRVLWTCMEYVDWSNVMEGRLIFNWQLRHVTTRGLAARKRCNPLINNPTVKTSSSGSI